MYGGKVVNYTRIVHHDWIISAHRPPTAYEDIMLELYNGSILGYDKMHSDWLLLSIGFYLNVTIL